MRPLRATAVLLLALTAVFGVPLSRAGAEPDHTDPSQAVDAPQAAAGWLARQLVDGDHIETDFGGVSYPDQGLTADAVLAFAAADVASGHAAAATEWLSGAEVMSAYIGTGDESYPGSISKLALVALARGEDPEAFGEVEADLLELLQATKNPETGRFSDKSQYGDFTNGITQSLAIIALERAGRPDAQATDFLAASQCDDGGFPLQFPAPEQPCTSEADVTGFAIQALLAAGRTATAGAALDYLESAQDASGGFGGTGPTSGLNANSTGLAAQALRAGGRTEAADAAVRFLTGLQVGCDAPTDHRGAIAYDSTGFEPSTAVRATAQALYGLAGVGLLAVDSDGDVATVPVLACAPPVTQPPATTTSTTAAPPATTPPTTTVAARPAPQGATGGSELAATGVRPAPAVALGGLLVLAGGIALQLSRLHTRPLSWRRRPARR